MQENTQDFEQAERFLSRYLPASIKLIDNYLKLSDKQVESKDVEEILNKLEEVLQRLENAFQTEYLSHIENHTIDVKTDLATLDTLLRIKGY